MATSKKTFAVVLHVRNARTFMQLYGHRIGQDKEFENPSEALNDLLDRVFLFIDIMGVKT